jgi:ankyrin repeat protein
MSTLEAMQCGKLPYYQTMEQNEEFVTTFLTAIKSIVTESPHSTAIIQFVTLLFSSKPYRDDQLNRTKNYLQNQSLCSSLAAANKKVIAHANGKISTHLLTFITQSQQTSAAKQLNAVLYSLRKPNESITPTVDQALRRAAAWGRIFELKALIRYIATHDTGISINSRDQEKQRTALHWATMTDNLAAVKILIMAGANVNIKDSEGNTALEIATAKKFTAITELLLTNSVTNANSVVDKENIQTSTNSCMGYQAN